MVSQRRKCHTFAAARPIVSTGDERSVDFSAVPGRDFRRRLSGKLELQLPKQEQLILLRLCITGQDDHPIVRRGQFDIDHLHGGEFFEHDPRRQSRRQRLQPLFQRDQQTISQKRNENMGFDSGFELVIDRTDRQIVLQLLERLLDLDQLQIEPPQMAGIVALDIGAQQISTAFV